MDKQAVYDELRAAYKHLTRAQRLAQGDEPYSYDEGKPVVPENETALEIGHAATWVYNIYAALGRPEEGKEQSGEGLCMKEHEQTAVLDVEQLGRLVHQAMVQQVKRDGWSEEAVTRWESLSDTARGEFRAVAVAVARAALDAAVAHLRADLGAEMRTFGTEGTRLVWGQGYEDALNALHAFAQCVTPTAPAEMPDGQD